MSPAGAIFVPFPPKTGINLLYPRLPPQSLDGSRGGAYDRRLVSVQSHHATECRAVKAEPHLRCASAERQMPARLLLLEFSRIYRRAGVGGLLLRSIR